MRSGTATRAGSYATAASSVAKLTEQDSTPSTRDSFFSTRAAQDAQVMPSISSRARSAGGAGAALIRPLRSRLRRLRRARLGRRGPRRGRRRASSPGRRRRIRRPAPVTVPPSRLPRSVRSAFPERCTCVPRSCEEYTPQGYDSAPRQLGRDELREGGSCGLALARVARGLQGRAQLDEVAGEVRPVGVDLEPLQSAAAFDHCAACFPEGARALRACLHLADGQLDAAAAVCQLLA